MTNNQELYQKKLYIIADHTRAICFIIGDGVLPSAKGRGYILRRLIRRSLSAGLSLQIELCSGYFEELVDSVIDIYTGVYDEIEQNKDQIVRVFLEETAKYQKAVEVGQKEWAKILGKNVQIKTNAE